MLKIKMFLIAVELVCLSVAIYLYTNHIDNIVGFLASLIGLALSNFFQGVIDNDL